MDGPRLIQKLPDGQARELALSPKTTIGRHPTNLIHVIDREVSKEHAVIERSGEEWQLRDLGSSNGTFVNGRKVVQLKLRDGDELTLGTSRFEFRLGPANGVPPPSRGVTVLHSKAEMEAILAALKSEDAAAGVRPPGAGSGVSALRRDYEKLRIAHEFSKQIGVERDMEALLDKILTFAFRVLPADNGVILLVDPASGELEPKAVKHRAERAGEVTLSGSVLARVRQSRESVLIADAGTDVNFSASASIIAQGIRSCMAVPLMVRDEVRGVLFLDSRERAAAFSEKDLQLLSGIAVQASLALERTELARQIEAEAVTRANLARFLSPALVEQAQKGQLELSKGGQETFVTVLFSDIRGFTSYSEAVGPQETVQLLNEYFEQMVDCVFRHGGVLDKFIGDAIMAIWGAPVQRPDDVERAVKSALEMQAVVSEFNESRAARGKPPVAIGIGVNAGPAVVGNMGSSKRLEYTVIGDTVNLASRLCGRAAPGEIVVSQAALSRTGTVFDIEALPPAVVKGKSAAVPVFRVVGVAELTGVNRG